MRAPKSIYPLRVFCEAEGVSRHTVLYRWSVNGRAPKLIPTKGGFYLISKAEWDAWRARLNADRIKTGNIKLRAPLPKTPMKRGRIAMRESTEGL